MTLHFPDEVDTNLLTIEAIDPKSGTAEFKATAVRIDKIVDRLAAAGRRLTPDGPEDRRRARRPTTSGPPSTSVLGPAPRRPAASRRRSATTSRAAARAASARHLLLPTLHAVNDRVGWISRGAINYIAERLDVAPADIYGVATFYALFSTVERPPARSTCASTSCAAPPAGSTEHDLPAGHPPVAVPRRVRAGAGRARDRGRRAATSRGARAGDGGRGAPHRRRRVARRRAARGRRRAAGRRRRPVARCCCAASAASTRRASTTTGRPAATRRCGGRSPSDRPRSSARSPTPGSSAAAARRSRPDASGTPSPASRPARTTSCATPTSPSPARSRTAC